MKAVNRVLRITLAATLVLSQGAWLAPALASSGKQQVVVVIGAEELKSEYGAGGSGGGTTPTPPSNPDYPSCTYNFDNDGYCDNYTSDVYGVIRDSYGAAYKRVGETIYWYCDPQRADSSGYCNVDASFVSGQSKTFTVQFELSAGLGREDLINAAVGAGYESSLSQETGVGSSTRIPARYAIRALFEAQGKYWTGGYNVRFTDNGDGPRSWNLTFGFPVTSGYGRHPYNTWRKTTYQRIIGYWDNAIRY
jgi:hypothetical protein